MTLKRKRANYLSNQVAKMLIITSLELHLTGFFDVLFEVLFEPFYGIDNRHII